MLKAFFTNSKKPQALVIGSVLVDIIASVRSSELTSDSVATVDQFRLGGSAFNIFASLTETGISAKIMSGVRRDSVFADVIRMKVKRHGSDPKLIKFSETAPEGVFLAFTRDKEVERAATSTAVDETDLEVGTLERLITKSQVCVIDLSLSTAQIQTVMTTARKRGCPVVCNGTSDGRITKLKSLGEWSVRLNALVCTEREMAALIGVSFDEVSKLSPQKICSSACADYVLVTKGEQGLIHYDARQSRAIEVPAVTPAGSIVSTLGAGDAVTACYAAEVADAKYQQRDFSLDLFRQRLQARMPSILGVEGAVPGNMNLVSRLDVAKHYSGGNEAFLGISVSRWQAIGGLCALIGIPIAIALAFIFR